MVVTCIWIMMLRERESESVSRSPRVHECEHAVCDSWGTACTYVWLSEGCPLLLVTKRQHRTARTEVFPDPWHAEWCSTWKAAVVALSWSPCNSHYHVYADCYWKLILLRANNRMGSILTDYAAYSQDGLNVDRLYSMFTGWAQCWQIMFHVHRMGSMLTDYVPCSQDGLNVDRLCSMFTGWAQCWQTMLPIHRMGSLLTDYVAYSQDVFNIDRLCCLFTEWAHCWQIMLHIHMMYLILTDYVAYSQNGLTVDRLCSIFTGCIQHWLICCMSVFTGCIQHWLICCMSTGYIAYIHLMTGCAS